MKLTLNQFEVLTYLERTQEEKHSQREIATACRVSLGGANKVLQELLEEELIKAAEGGLYTVTLKGYEWLEPHRVRRAVFMAAGFGSRMVPLTLNTPKPLIKVHGKPIIETLLDAVLEVGIRDIVIVRGYLGEQFDLLLKKYPMIRLVDNPLYNEANNISSAFVVRDLLAGAYIMDSDLVLYNKHLIRKYEYATNYIGMPVEVTDDWCFETKKGIITKMKVGGTNVHHMYGLSYWSPEDGRKLEHDIAEVFHSPGGKECFWDDVALTKCPKHYQVMVRPVDRGDIVEIDSYRELCAIDPVYNVK